MKTDRSQPFAPCIVIAPDSFKGSLTAQQAAQAMGRGVRRAIPDATIHLCPMADGGEGTLDAMLTSGGRVEMLSVRDACGDYRDVPVGILPDGTGVIETAKIVGITDQRAMAIGLGARSTEGVGDAIRLLLRQGVRRILIALGGSSTNDGGSGMLRALGLSMLDADGKALAPGPEALAALARIDASQLEPLLREATLIGMSDVNNPLCGPMGASAVFGPQKGADARDVATFDRTLEHFSGLLAEVLQRQTAEVPGSGAAGGLGYGLTMIGGAIQSGAEIVCDQIGLDYHLAKADWVITGEGRSDTQTLQGKAPFVVADHARRAGVRAILLSGAIDIHALPELGKHFSGCFSIVPGPMPLAHAIAEADGLAEASAFQLAALWRLV